MPIKLRLKLSNALGEAVGRTIGRSMMHRAQHGIPGFGRLASEIGQVVNSLRERRASLETYRKFSTSSPLGLAGIREVRRAALNPLLKEREKSAINTAADQAEYYQRRSDVLHRDVKRFRKIEDQAMDNRREAARSHRESIADYHKAAKGKSQADAYTRRLSKARASIQRQYYHYRSMGLKHKPSANPYAADEARLKKRLNEADARLRKAAKNSRTAYKNVISKRSDVHSAAKKSRMARADYVAKSGRTMAANAAARAASRTARQTAAHASAAAAAGNMAAASRMASMAIGGMATGILASVALFKQLKNSLNNFAEETNHANRQLAHYSGAIGNAFNRLAYGDMRRTFATAAGTERTTVALADAINRMRDNQLQLNISTRNITNTMAAAAAGFSGGFDKHLGALTGEIDRLVQGFTGGHSEDFGQTLGEIFGTIFDPITKSVEFIANWLGFQKQAAPVFQGGPADNFVRQMMGNAAMKPAAIRERRIIWGPDNPNGFGG